MNKFYDLSPKQAEDWDYNYNLRPDQLPNVMEFSVNLKDIDLGLFSQAFELLVKKHESLRTTFPLINIKTVQRVQAYSPLFAPTPIDSLTDYNEEDYFRNILCEMKDISKAPLIRCFILIKSNSTYKVKILIHHIISDYWSIQIIKNELVLLYQQLSGAVAAESSAPGEQLGEYIRRNHDYFNIAHNHTIQSWLNKIKTLQWQTNYHSLHQNIGRLIKCGSYYNAGCNYDYKSTQLVTNPTGASYKFYINEKLHNNLIAYKNDRGKSVSIIILTCLNLLGAFLTANDQILIQTHYLNRNQDTEHLIGNFIGKVLLLNQIDRKTHLSDLTDQINFNFYDDCSKVIFNSSALEEVDITTKCFIFYNFLPQDVSGSGQVDISGPQFSDARVESPLVCQVFEYENTLEFKISYHCHFYNKPAIQYLVKIFQDILSAIVEYRSTSVEDLFSELTGDPAMAFQNI